MIENIRLGSVNSNIKQAPQRDNQRQNPTFKGIGEGLIGLVQMCEKYPMVNVSVLDLSTAIVPRTIIETKESNGYAGMEAFRREGSGLVVNCLIPSFIVMGLAKLIQKPIMKGFGKADLSKVWANEESINVVTRYLSSAEGKGSQKLENAITAFMQDLSGVDGNETKAFLSATAPAHNVTKGIRQIAKSSLLEKPSKLFNKGYSRIVNSTHMAEHIQLKGHNGFLSKNLEGYLQDFVSLHKAIMKEGITNSEELAKFTKKSIKLVNWKSIAGLGVIIPLAVSMQPINRWITRKSSGQKGAPIYKDFGTDSRHKEMTPKDKKELLAQKFISIGSMVGVAGLSMFMDRPVLKNIFQFKGLFPTMDQARIISTATFASRMAAAEDKNELREATVRDIATFSSFYFLGDYVAKGIATILQKTNKGVTLINVLKKPKEGANILQKAWHWAKHTSLKSSDELFRAKDKRLRTYCQIGNIGFSLLALGVFIPYYTRTKTNKKRAEELAKLNAEKSNVEIPESLQAKKVDNLDYYSQAAKDKPVFKSFLNSQKEG